MGFQINFFTKKLAFEIDKVLFINMHFSNYIVSISYETVLESNNNFPSERSPLYILFIYIFNFFHVSFHRFSLCLEIESPEILLFFQPAYGKVFHGLVEKQLNFIVNKFTIILLQKMKNRWKNYFLISFSGKVQVIVVIEVDF